MFLLKPKQLYLLFQSLASIKIRTIYNCLDVFKRKLQFAKQQYVLKALQICIVIQSVACIGVSRRMKKTNLVIIL